MFEGFFEVRGVGVVVLAAMLSPLFVFNSDNAGSRTVLAVCAPISGLCKSLQATLWQSPLNPKPGKCIRKSYA